MASEPTLLCARPNKCLTKCPRNDKKGFSHRRRAAAAARAVDAADKMNKAYRISMPQGENARERRGGVTAGTKAIIAVLGKVQTGSRTAKQQRKAVVTAVPRRLI